MAVTPRISLVTLGVRDLAGTTTFYESIGFELSSASVEGDVSFFRSPGSILALWGVTDLAADAGVEAPTTTGFAGTAFAINVASREEVDDAIEAAGAAGGRVVKPGTATEWGGYNGYFADPEGNLWEVAHNPFWPLDERGLPVLPE
ncbi:MAG TPA: VOC family protein [Jatrophihabitantaceae bacterium]|nr:VOC family protein [Jatrophihabitantaceae bacterium]